MRTHLDLTAYQTFVFDCDGVILNSNQVKTEAFYRTALPYGEHAAQQLVDYHRARGGVSRYQKLSFFLEEIVPKGKVGPRLNDLLENFSIYVREGLLACEIASGLELLRERTSQAVWLIVSGGDEAELRSIFNQRDLAYLFDGGIFGSPDTKEMILARQVSSGRIHSQTLFLGDSVYDFKAAAGEGLDFLFISSWSEVENWEAWVKDNGIISYPTVDSLLELG